MFTLQPRGKPHPAFIDATAEIRTIFSILTDDFSAVNVHTSSCPLVCPTPLLTLVWESLQEVDSPSHTGPGALAMEGRGGRRPKIVSTKTDKFDWPWSGAVRRHIYLDFTVYMVLLTIFSFVTVIPYSDRSRESYHLVQSIQATLVKEVRDSPKTQDFQKTAHVSLSLLRILFCSSRLITLAFSSV
jgi:hypothetical protein